MLDLKTEVFLFHRVDSAGIAQRWEAGLFPNPESANIVRVASTA
jgi:hypothetical protein